MSDEEYDYEEEEDRDCPTCVGTGIGQHGDPDTSRCGTCKGRGYFLPEEEDW